MHIGVWSPSWAILACRFRQPAVPMRPALRVDAAGPGLGLYDAAGKTVWRTP